MLVLPHHGGLEGLVVVDAENGIAKGRALGDEAAVSALQSNERGDTLIFTGARKKRWTAGNS